MESEMSITTVRDLLAAMQSEDVSQAEKTLQGMTTHPQFFSWIYFIMSNPQQEEWLKTIASSFINSVFAASINEQNWDSIFQGIIKILQESNIKQLDKRIFEKSIIKSIETGTLQNRQQWVGVIYQCLKNIINYDTAYLIIACMAASDIAPSLLYDVIKNTYDQILSSLDVNVANANLMNEMVKMWIVVIDTMRIEDVPNRAVLTKMIGSPYAFNLISGVYELQAQENTLICMKKGLEELNFLKYEVADFHKRMLDIELQLSDDAFVSVMEFTKGYVGKIGNSLVSMASNRQNMQNKGCQDLVTSLLSVLRLYLTITPEEFKLEDVKYFINHILFPLLEIQDDERYTFEESPSDFNTLAEDCCDKQTFEILKTEAAKLLQKFGDKVEESAHYAMERAVESLKVKMGYSQNNKFGDLKVLQIQTSFLILSIFSYALNAYPDEVEKIRLILNDERVKMLPPLELSRIFIFLGYNYNEVYKNPSEGEHWLKFVLGYSAHPTAFFCALDFLSNIVDDYFSQPLIDKLTDLIATGNLGLIWDISSKIIERHYQSLSGNAIATLISKVFVRIEREVHKLENGETKSTLDLINSLRTFGNILKEARKEQKGYEATAVKKEFLMTKIWPILDFYTSAVKYDVDDEVIKVATEMINAMDFIVPEFTKYLTQFISAFKANKYSQKVFLKLFNQYLFKADFNKNMNEIIMILVCLKEALLNTLGNLTDKDGKMKTLPYLRLLFGNTILIIQNSIALYGTYLLNSNNTDFFHEISSICVRLLPTSIENFEKSSSSRVIYSRIFNTLFLCHMHMPIDSIYPIFTLFQTQRIYHGYDTVVLALCISKQIFNEKDISAIVVMLSGLVKIVNLSTEKEEKIERRKQKKNQNKINANVKTIQDFDKILNSIDAPFKVTKEMSDILSELFCQMKHTNEELFNTVLKGLPHQDFNSYQKFVDFDSLEKKKRVIVKVVDIKRSNTPVEAHRESTEMKDSDEQIEGPKRQRMKEKVEKKLKKTVKKRFHKEDHN